MHKQNQHIERIARSLARAAIIRANKVTKAQRVQRFFKPLRVRLTIAGFVSLIVLGEFTPILNVFMTAKVYAFEDPQSLLPKTTQAMADKLKFDTKNQVYSFNQDYVPQSEGALKQGGAKITATAALDATKGLKVTDPISKSEFGLKPQFQLKPGEQKENRVVYPLINNSGWLVYTMQAGNVKEDILLSHVTKDKMQFEYQLDIDDSLEPRTEKNGDIGVYGSSLPLSGQVSTGSDKDAELLQKARKSATKDKLMFTIPAPVIKESKNPKSSVKAHYEVKDKLLTLKVEGLKKGTYPLTIDPSVYVTSAQQFMQGNNDSNIDFNTSSDFIQKGQLTGARIPSWSSTYSFNGSTGIKAAGTAVTGGYMYVVGGSSSSETVGQTNVYWQKINDTTGALAGANPGNGTCTNFCTNSAYALPAGRLNLSVVAYNGYLFAIGGSNSTGCTAGNTACTTVYSSKLGANGEPLPWVSAGTLTSTGRKNFGATAYNGRIYIGGGQTNATANGTSSVESAVINPDGTIGTWTAMTNLPYSPWGLDFQQYNGYLYALGGAETTTTRNYVYYTKIKSDGTLASWVQATGFTNARATSGGTFSTIYGGYMYISSGCSAVATTSPQCSTILNDLQLASINADGSVTAWSTQSVTTARAAGNLTSWRGFLFSVGGCTASGVCASPITTAALGDINTDGDVSANVTATTLPAAGTGATQGGRMAGGVVINNGFIYNIGGCIVNDCSSDSTNTSYAAIAANGSIGTWTTQANTGLANTIGMGVTVHNNIIYAVGGGTGGAYVSTMSTVPINANGSLNGNWTNTAGILANTAGYPFVFARTVPGNSTQSYLYSIGGCSGSANSCSGTYYATVRRCTVTTATGALVAASCTNAAATMLQLGVATGIFGGTVYGNYIYLAGGANSLTGANVSASGATCTVDASACGAQTNLIQYALINSSGNITRTDGTTTTGGWHIASTRLSEVRRRTTVFGANGYFYVVAGHDGLTGQTLNDVLRGKIDTYTGDVIMDSSPLATTITKRWDLRAAQANGFIYVLGGCTTGSPPNLCGTTTGNTSADGMNGTAEYLQIYNNASGSPLSYTAQAAVTAPADRFGASATINNGYIYLAGGCTSTTDCTTYSNNISYAPLNPDGTITAANWVTTGTIPAARAFGCLVTLGSTLYYLGGQNTTTVGTGYANNNVYYSAIGGAGAPGTWNNATNVLPANRNASSCTTYNNHMYVAAGTNQNATYQFNVLMSPALVSGGDVTTAWSTLTSQYSGARSGAVAVAYGNNFYVLGGFDGTNYLLDVQYASIASDGTLGTWRFSTPLPQAIRQADGFAANGYLYIFGGRSAATTCTANTYVAPINANPIINKVVQDNPSALGTWSQTSVGFTGTRYGVAAAYDSGRAYLLGGMCNGTLTNTNRVVYGTLQSQPQISKYSIMVNADSDVYPTKFLANGIDSGIGANWYLNYASSTSAANTFGQSTSFGKLRLGVPIPYTALDSVGTDTLAARYYYLALTIDASQSFGFPEDSTRGPTIDDMTLQLSADPAKRLRNGKTFIGGQQQPLDSPF